MDHFHLSDGRLHCEDVPLSDIADEVGTPVYVYSTATSFAMRGLCARRWASSTIR